MSMRLYDLTEQYNDLIDLVESSDDKEALQAMLDGLGDAIETKMENIIKLWKSKCGERDYIKAERMRLEEREKRSGKDADWLLAYVEREMKKLNMDQVPSKLFSIKLQKNPPSVDVLDQDLVPIEYLRIIPENAVPDKVAILEQLKQGVEIPGVAIKQEKSIRVK